MVSIHIIVYNGNFAFINYPKKNNYLPSFNPRKVVALIILVLNSKFLSLKFIFIFKIPQGINY